jgi:hypothetical protein
MCATDLGEALLHPSGVEQLNVAIVSLDPATRLAAARAFDRAPASWSVSLHKSLPENADVVVLTPEVEGDGVRFDPAHPEKIIEDVIAVTHRATSGVVVTGVSGGVGATSVAVHLAASLARRSKTCLVDLDPRGGLRRRLGMPSDALTWADVGEDDESLRLAALPIAPGLRAYVSPPNGELDPTPLLHRVLQNFHHVVLDAPLDILQIPLQVVSAGVLVAPPTFPAIERAGEVLSCRPIRWAVVTNRLGPGGEATRSELERVLGRPIGLELPCAPRLRDAEDDRRMLNSAWSRWARRIDRLADVLEQK